jgi:hypothetical protein
VDVSGLSRAQAAGLAALLPTWEEAIAAGTDRLVLDETQLAQVRRGGHNPRVVGPAPAAVQAWPGCWRTLDETYRWADLFARTHPWLVEVLDIGDSFCLAAGSCRTPGRDVIAGRDLLVLRITNTRSAAPKRARLLVDGGLHAREIAGPEVVAAFAGDLVESYGVDPQVTYLLDYGEVYAGLDSNPDGRALVELGAQPKYGGSPWLWRKNGHDERRVECPWPPSETEHYGVDLNRNHAFKWDLPGASPAPCQQTYRGRAQASEPEIKAYEAFARQALGDWRGPGDDEPADRAAAGIVVNLHSATMPGTVLFPWGWTNREAPDAPELRAIADRYAELSGGYDVNNSLYDVSGNTRDWAYGELGVPAFVVELQGRTFFPGCNELAEVVASQRAPLQAALALSDRPYERVYGPEVAELEVAASVPRGAALRVRALLVSSRASGLAVSRAELTMGVPGGTAASPDLPSPGVETGSGLAMLAEDGSFDEPVEWASGLVNTGSLAPGTYYVVVKAMDQAGRWGPARAAFASTVPATEPPATATQEPTVTCTPTPLPTETPTAASTEEPTAPATELPTVAPTTPTGSALVGTALLPVLMR